MLKLKIVCPTHNLPYQYMSLTQKPTNFLRCNLCPFDSRSVRISTSIQSMKMQIINQKAKQRQRSRSRSMGKKQQIQSEQQYDEKQMILIQRIAQQQVLILELVMKLLTEDQKKYVDSLDNKMDYYHKLWKQYEESTSNIMALNKLYQQNMLNYYIECLSQIGWKQMRLILNSLTNRNFLSRRIIKQSKQIVQDFKNSIRIGEDSVLKCLESLLGKVNNGEVNTDENREKFFIKKPKRSKSFAGIS